MKKSILLVLVTLLGFGISFAQQKITGKVVSKDDGQPVPFATVTVKGFSNALATTNNDGEYSIAIPSGGATLVFSFIGMKELEVDIAGRTTINAELEPEVETLQETVVIGYGTVKKSDVTGSISSIKAQDITKQAVTGVDQAIQGRLAGVQVVSNSGAPGASVAVRVRGIGTVNDSDPLYVVDGMPVNNIQFLNPSDVASMEVLKDASATAIYGSRGANGVVMITTKQGTRGKTVVSVDSYWGWQNTINNLKLLNGEEWYAIQEKINLSRPTPIDLNKVKINGEVPNTDWMKEIQKPNAFMHNYNASITGGDQGYRYALTGGYHSQQGTLKGTDFNRISLRLNTEKKVFNGFTVGTNIGISQSDRNTILEGSNTVGVVNTAIKLEPVIPVKYADGKYGYSPYIDYPNPVAAIDYSNNNIKVFSLVGNITGTVDIVKGLKFKTNFGLDMQKHDEREFTPKYYVSNSQQNAEATNKSVRIGLTSWVWENTLNYDKTFGDIHSLSVLAGYTAEETVRNELWGLGKRMPNNSPSYWLVGAGLNPERDSDETQWESAMLSYLGRINYALMDKYLITASVRVDGSSRFSRSHRYGTFPSVALAWKLTNEEFMKNLNAKWLSSAKLRFGWGAIGNQNIDNNKFQNVLNTSNQYRYLFGKEEILHPGAAITNLSNENLKWEQTESSNFGIDLSLFNNKLDISADYYIKTTKDMLLTERIEDYLGYELGPTTNVGSIRNKGFELVLGWKDEIAKEFRYNINVNISTFQNEVLNLGAGSALYGASIRNGFATITRVGDPIGAFFGYQTAGLIQTQEQLDAVKPLQPNAGLGDVIFVNNNGDSRLNDADKVILGSPIPDFTFGINLGMEYKGFDISAFIYGSQGNEIFNAMRYFTYDLGDVTNKDKNVLNHWTPTNTNTNVPRLNGMDKNDNNRISDRYVEDGSFIRLKNLQLGYALPSSLTKKINIERVRLYVSAQNLFTITNYSGSDPEIGQISPTGYLTRGVDIGTYPQSSVWTVGLNLTF